MTQTYLDQVQRVRAKDLEVAALLLAGTIRVDTALGRVFKGDTELKPSKCPNGYIRVHLPIAVKTRSQRLFRVHRLVAIAASGVPSTPLEVAHLDHDRTNNSAVNLAFMTRAENIRHAISSGRWNRTMTRVMTDEQVYDARKLRSAGWTLGQISRHLQVDRSTVKSWIEKDLHTIRRGSQYALKSPTGQLYTGHNLKFFCEQMGLPYGVLQARRYRGALELYEGWTNVDPRPAPPKRSRKRKRTSEEVLERIAASCN